MTHCSHRLYTDLQKQEDIASVYFTLILWHHFRSNGLKRAEPKRKEWNLRARIRGRRWWTDGGSRMLAARL